MLSCHDVFTCYWSLMCSKIPTLKVCWKSMYTRHRNMCWITTIRDLYFLMKTTLFFQTIIYENGIYMNCGLRKKSLSYRLNQFARSDISNVSHPYTHKTLGITPFCSNNDDRLTTCIKSSLSTFVYATNNYLIYFDNFGTYIMWFLYFIYC